MMTFLKTILVILLVYFGLKFLIRLLTPYIMRYVAKKAGQKFEQAFGQNPMNSEPQKEGKVTIDKKPAATRRSTKTVGEYVDFEEIKE